MRARNKEHINYDIMWLGALRAIKSYSLPSITANLNILEKHLEENGYKEDVNNYIKAFEEQKAPLEEDSPFLLDKRENKTGDTLLIRAACLNQFDTVKRLLNAGALTHIRNNHNETALFYALNNCNIEMVKFLLSHGATFAEIPLNFLYDFLSKVEIHVMRDWLNLLNNNQVDITKVSEKGYRFMDYVATHIFNTLEFSEKSDYANDFIDQLLILKETNPALNIADCRILNEWGNHKRATPLIAAVHSNNLNKVLKLLEFNNPESINLQDGYGSSALEYACRLNHNIEIIHALLSHGAHPNDFQEAEIYNASLFILENAKSLSLKYAAFSCLNILYSKSNEKNLDYKKLLEKHEPSIGSLIPQRIDPFITSLPKKLIGDYLLFTSKPFEYKQEEKPSSQKPDSHTPKP